MSALATDRWPYHRLRRYRRQTDFCVSVCLWTIGHESNNKKRVLGFGRKIRGSSLPNFDQGSWALTRQLPRIHMTAPDS